MTFGLGKIFNQLRVHPSILLIRSYNSMIRIYLYIIISKFLKDRRTKIKWSV